MSNDKRLSRSWELKCTRCGSTQSAGTLGYCSSCGGIVEVVPHGAHETTRPRAGIWRFADHLPKIYQPRNMITLGEGDTRLLPCRGDRCGTNVLLKDESRNPSGSFKDRGTAVTVSVAVDWGTEGVVTASSGNAGSSIAQYCAAAGIPSVVCVPADVPREKITNVAVFGGDVVLVPGGITDAVRVAEIVAERLGWLNATSTFRNPLVVEGYKTIAYEIAEQLTDRPAWVVVPTGAGPLAAGIAKGFMEISQRSGGERAPRIMVVQAEGCAPIVRAHEQGAPIEVWEGCSTEAGAIGDPLVGYPQDGERVLRMLAATAGTAIAVSDAEIAQGVRCLAETEGVFVEFSSGASCAALRKARACGLIDSELVVLLCTGNGLKDPLSVNESNVVNMQGIGVDGILSLLASKRRI